MTTTANKGYTLPAVNADFGIWGGELNGNISILDLNLGGIGTLSVAGSSNVIASGAQAQNLVQQLTGTLTGSIQYLLPATGGFYIIDNQSAGSYAIAVGNGTSTATGTTVTVPQGERMVLWSDGTNMWSATDAYLPLNPGSLSVSGLLTAGTVAATGAVTAASGSVTGNFTAGTLTTAGAVSAGTLAVTSSGTIGGTLAVTSSGTIGGTLTVGSTLTAGGLFQALGNATVTGTLQATNIIATASLTVVGALAVGGAVSAAAAAGGANLPQWQQVLGGNGAAWNFPGHTLNTNYTNSQGKPIEVRISCNSSSGAAIQPTIAGVAQPAGTSASPTAVVGVSFLVPTGATYSANVTSGSGSNVSWAELY